MANYWQVEFVWGAGGQSLMNTLFYRDEVDVVPGEADAEQVANLAYERIWNDHNPLEPSLIKITPAGVTLKQIRAKMYDNNFNPWFDRYAVKTVEEGGGVLGADCAPQFYVPVSFNIKPGTIIQKAPKRSYIAWGPFPLSWCNFDTGYLNPANVDVLLANLACLNKSLEWITGNVYPVRLRRDPVIGWIGWGRVSGITLNNTFIKTRRSRLPEA